MRTLFQNKGIIAYVTLIILLGIIILSLAMGRLSLFSNSSSKNYNYKTKTFNAADGVMTLLAQDLLDFNEDSYIGTVLLDKDIGNPLTAGYYNRSSGGIDTVKGSGKTLGGGNKTSDQFHFAYCPMAGDFQVTVKVVSIQNTSYFAKAALHIRETDAANSAFFHAAMTSGGGYFVQYRASAGAGAQQPVSEGGSAPIWLRVTRTGNTFRAEKSSNGSSWTLSCTQSISMSPSVLVGLGVASYAGATLCTSLFSNLSGLGTGAASGNMIVGNDSIPVDYTITQTGSNTFLLSTHAYFLNSVGDKMYNTRLIQDLSRETAGKWSVAQKDSALIPVTLYDFRADQSHPEFNVRGTIGLSYMTNIPANFVQDTLDEQRKPVLRKDYTFRNCFMAQFHPSWYTIPASIRVSNTNADSASKVACYISNGYKFTWDFCDSLHSWFRPWGDPPGSYGNYEFDTVTGRWSGLVRRKAVDGTDAPDSGWVTANWDSTYAYANIVFYDTLVFRELPAPDTGMFQFGDSVHAWTDDAQFFVRSCNYTDPWTGHDFKSDEWRFMPLKERGFKYDATRYIPPGANACCDKQNFGFTMEIHRKFTYKPGQIFKFRGDDDVWLFINNKKVIDLGGVHLPCSATVDLDTCGLTSGQEYNFDFFYCERNVESSNILITTNLIFFTPPQMLKRSWMRDYGNLD